MTPQGQNRYNPSVAKAGPSPLPMTRTADACPLPPGPAELYDLGSTDDSLEVMQALFARFGDFYRVRSPAREADTFVVTRPADIKHVLVNNQHNYTKGVGHDRIKILLGNGIMVSEGAMWRRQRRMIQPMFHRQVVQRFLGVMAHCNRTLLERWTVAAERGERVNLTEDMSELTLRVMLESLFSEDLPGLDAAAGGNPFALVTEESARDLQFAVRFRTLTRVVAAIVEARRREDRLPFDFLSMLMQARDKENHQPMAERELIDEVMTLVVAGHETTASALNWTWYLLAHHPQAERRMHEEIDHWQVPETLSLDALNGLAYTGQVVSEALRLYPPGWLLTRRAVHADRLGEFPVSPRTDVFISPYLMHRHPQYWPEPERFLPERFAPEQERSRNHYSYIPFAVGARHCVGESFAIAEMKLHLATLARHFCLRDRDAGPVEIEARVNLRTRHNLHLLVEKRQPS